MSLQVVDVHKRFGAMQALDGMNFTVQSGRLFGFVGSNGAGKTTTMRIMLGVLEADSGEILRDGKQLSFADRRMFGYMPEERGLYPKMRVADQLVYFARLHGLDKQQARAKMEYWTDRLGVGARRKDQVQALSLGNQQRVQLAAALIHEPDVLVLDEPFSGLDPIAVQAMSEVLKAKVASGATVLFSSHQLDLVERLCDDVGICAHGKIVAQGTIEQLRTTAVVYYDVTTGADARVLAAYLSGTALRGDDAARLAGGEHTLPALPTQVLDTHTVRVTVPNGVTDQELLHSTLAVAAVHGFTRYRPHLAELFSEVVQVDAAPEAPAEAEKGRKRRQRWSGLARPQGKHRISFTGSQKEA